MKKVFVLVLVLLFILSFNFVSSGSIDSEIQKITNYAEDFETGNINYVQLLVYSSAVREEINEELGATNREMGGILKEEQLKSILGDPTEETNWVWVENEQHETKLDKDVPVWKRIIFDGKKIQIRLTAWPSVFKKSGEFELFYRLNFEIDFKRPEQQLDMSSKINEIKSLAEAFNSDPSSSNAEALAEASVSTERTFESYFRQNQGKCEDIMKSIFGSENQKETQQLLVQEVEFFEGDNFKVILRIEFCDDCEWNWINLDMRLEGRGPGFKPPKQSQTEIQPDQFKQLSSEEFKTKILETLDNVKQELTNGNYNAVFSAQQKLNALNWAWNDKSNNVWQEIEKIFEPGKEIVTPEEAEEYGWIKKEQDRRQRERELRKQNYEIRKQFYLALFAPYEKKEFYFSQIEFEKRLVEEFKEFGEEICDNNQDDNKNEQIDCQDEQCIGKICGKQTVTIDISSNETTQTREEVKELYCIQKICQLKEEIIEKREIVCGNHICEENETTENCAEDCALCPQYEPIECKGQVIFKGINKNNCPLEPVCLEENETCMTNEDCIQPLCGISSCVEGRCQTTTLEECREPECIDGQERIQNCESGESIVIERCVDGLWINTDIECQVEEVASCEGYCRNQPHIMCVGQWDISGDYPDCNCNFICGEEGIIENECTVRSDCGGENDVCSNGRCETIPEVIPIEPITEPTPEPVPESSPEVSPEQTPEEQSEPEQTPEQSPVQESSSEPTPEPTITGEFIKTIKTITGFVITGFQTEELPPSEPAPELSPEPETQPEEPPIEIEQPPTQPITEERPREYEDQEQERFGEEREDRRDEDERRSQEERERCGKECNRPCVEKCIRESCGETMECNIDEEIKKCEQDCNPDETCIEKCMEGGDWWKEYEQKDKHKEEKGVFKAGGMCRTAQQKTEGFIFFDGWGEPFQRIQSLKQKYYSGGQADWCKYEFENLKKQREEFEKGFNEEFVKWFFEKYLANSAEDWEQHISGIFELYWKDVDLSMRIAGAMNCLETQELPEFNLINVKYETEYGKLEFWEEIKTAKVPGPGGSIEANVISPYMKIWIFPPKSFIIYEMKQAMKNHEFPGPPEQKLERKNEEGPTAEEREFIKQDEKFMKQIKKISEKYGGTVDAVIRFVDNGEVVFNLYAQVNENDIIKVKPMLPEEVPQEDIRIEIEFQKIYDIIYMQEKEMRGERIESPPWDRKTQPIQKIKETVNVVKMYFKARDMLNSAKIYPETSEKDAKALMKSFFSMMMKSEKGKPEIEAEMKNKNIAEEKGVWEEKGKITGEVIFE